MEKHIHNLFLLNTLHLMCNIKKHLACQELL